MKEPKNPFPVGVYSGPDSFCDRKEECKRLLMNAENGINTTMFSIRRMGKTGLLQHFLTLNQKKFFGIYVDLFATQNLRDFTNSLANAALLTFPEKTSFGTKLMDLIRSFRPVLSFDPLTSNPEVSFDFANAAQQEQSLQALFDFFEGQNKPVIVVFDEFQQVRHYPEKNTEALLRTKIQQLQNVHFVFCGSNRHLLVDIFNNSKKPFYTSTQFMQLAEIDQVVYRKFIKKHLEKKDLQISSEAIDFILEFTLCHTFYTQSVCNRIYAERISNITLEDVKFVCHQLLLENESMFYQYRQLITRPQFSLLSALAHEMKLVQPTAKNFISTYNLGTPASIKRSLTALMEKELIHNEGTKHNSYRVTDVFLLRWLQINF